VSLILTAVFFVLTQHLFNEESKLCILPKKYREFHMFDTNQDGEISQQEINDAVALLDKVKKQKATKHREKLYDYFQKNKV